MIIKEQSSRKNKHEESMADRRAESRGGEEQGEDKQGGSEGRSKGHRQGKRREQGRDAERYIFGVRGRTQTRMIKIKKKTSHVAAPLT